jgi:CheY-like chemotaxis protein
LQAGKGHAIFPKILLVDDIQMFLEIQKDLLKPLPVQIATAADGQEALGVVEQFAPDLVILDMNMPRMNGLACCQALKRHRDFRRIPVIMTVSIFGGDAELCRAAGCDALLHKPLDAGIFLDTVASFIPAIERRSRRVPLLAPVVVRTGGRTFGGALLDISKSGASLEPDECMEVGAAVDLTFHLRFERACTVQLQGCVVRQLPADIKGMNTAVAIAFTPSAKLQEDLARLFNE